MSSLRLLIPRAPLSLSARQLQTRLLFPAALRAYSTSPPKPRVLEKPERFNPPSHPARLRTKPKYYGPALSEKERDAQRTRSYPNMMPEEGTFMHWFLTNRTVHLVITMATLLSMVFAIWFQDFYSTTPYLDLLPPNSMFFSHPLAFLSRWFEVYAMHVQYVSQKTAERRKEKVDDVKKRSEYRKAHGLEQKGGFGNWTAKPDVVPAASHETMVDDASPVAKDTAGSHVDFEGNVQPARKRILGIW